MPDHTTEPHAIKLLHSRVAKVDIFTIKGWLYENESGGRGWHIVCTSFGAGHPFWFQEGWIRRPVLRERGVDLYEFVEPRSEEKAAILKAIGQWEAEPPS